MPVFGPIYCETLRFAGFFPAEPVNTFSNFAILFGIAAFFLVAKRAPRAFDLYVLSALLLANGAGSFLWHGTRTAWALTADVWPGLIFLLALMFFWARRLLPVWQAAALLAGFYVLSQFLRNVDFIPYGRWASMAPAVLLFGGWLVARTAAHSREAAFLGTASIASALLALFFRTVDQAACAYISFGTHFLWHILLSGAAFLGIRMLVILTVCGTAPRKTAVQAAAE